MSAPFVDDHGHGLGRHVRHDPRSRAYPLRAAALPGVDEPPVTRQWQRRVPVFNQGQLGSCTGMASTGAMGTDPFYMTLADVHDQIDASGAVGVYAEATELDPWPGTYPPEDTGSAGLSVAQVLKARGWISGYVHAFSVPDVVRALQAGPVILGLPWYSGMSTPSADGHAVVSGRVTGGHEVVADGVDVEQFRVWFTNSWGSEWGLHGRFYVTWDELARLLGEHGDATVLVPRTVPAPEPDHDAALVAVLDKWADGVRSTRGRAGKARLAYLAWKQANGY